MASNPYENLNDDALEKCIKRMARTLASKPKRKKTRDYVLAIRSEKKTAAQHEKELRALADQRRFEAAKAIAESVIDRAQSGIVSAGYEQTTRRTRKQRVSPIALHRKSRTKQVEPGMGWRQKRNCRHGKRHIPDRSGAGKRDDALAKAIRHILVRVQEYRCAICGQVLPENHHQATIDHVIPLAMGGIDALGNIVAVHRECNNAKSNDTPTGCEMIFLLLVNAKLGFQPQIF